MYNKLFAKILDSTIWLEPTPTRIVWVTLLAAMDETGFAPFASITNLAHRARVAEPEAEAAIACFEAPDKNSADPDNEGRRCERVPGGWMVLNAEKYRDIVTRAEGQAKNRERVRRHRERKRNGAVTPRNEMVMQSDTDQRREEVHASSRALDLSSKRGDETTPKERAPEARIPSRKWTKLSEANKGMILTLARQILEQFPDYADSDQRDELKIALAKAHLTCTPTDLVEAYDQAVQIRKREARRAKA